MSTAAEFKAQGNAFLQKKEFDDAIAAYTKAIELDSTDHVFFSNRSAAYLSKGDATTPLQMVKSVSRSPPSGLRDTLARVQPFTPSSVTLMLSAPTRQA
jgi:tetratricopeptide (TPR) repeat protein